jgi:hypothetical protein
LKIGRGSVGAIKLQFRKNKLGFPPDPVNWRKVRTRRGFRVCRALDASISENHAFRLDAEGGEDDDHDRARTGDDREREAVIAAVAGCNAGLRLR